MKLLTTTISGILLFSIAGFSQPLNANQDSESLQSRKGYFVFLMDSINTALQNLRNGATGNSDRFTYSMPGILAKDRMQGKILDEFTKVEVSGWTTYYTEDCGWPLGSIDKDWKAVEFSSRENLSGAWKMCYRRILLRIEVCGGNRFLAVYKKYNDNPIIETFANDPISKHESFQEEDEAIKFLLKEMRRAVPYPVENGYSLSGNFYSERRNHVLEQLHHMAYFTYDPNDPLCGVWLDERENQIYFVGPAYTNGLTILPLDYPSLFNKNSSEYALTILKNVKVNAGSIEFNYAGDVWTQTRQVRSIDMDRVTFASGRAWTRIITTGNKNGSGYYEMIRLKAQKIEDDRKKKQEEQTIRHNESLLFFEKNKLRPEVVVSPTGLQYEIIRPAKGNDKTAPDDAWVFYNFTVKSPEGEILCKNSPYADPYSVNYGQQRVGDRISRSWWKEAFQTVPKGGLYRFYVPFDQIIYSTDGFSCSKCSEMTKATHFVIDIEMLKIKK